MSDLFTRLAERVLGVAASVRPATTPLFAAGPPFPIAPTLTLQEEASQVGHQALGEADPARTLVVAPSSLVNPREFDRLAPSSDVAVRREPVRGDLPDVGKVVPILPFSRVLSAGRDPSVAAARSDQVDGGDARLPVVVDPPRTGVTEHVTLVGLDTSRSSEAMIRVTIGRVEVKAVVAQQPPARPRVAPRPPALSLEDYLRQRSNGQR